jgi:hypothetical protein
VSGWSVLLVAGTSAYLGFQLTIRVVVYPQLASVPTAGFPEYEATHQRLVTRVVGPLFVLDGIGCLAAFVARPSASATLAGLGLLAVLLLTGLGAVPAHRALSRDFDAAVHHRLLVVDSLRLLAATASVAGAVWYASG